MLYEFKCRATGPVLMTQPVAERLLAILGKEPAPKGILLPAAMPAAIAALEDAIARERARPSPPAEPAPAADPDADPADDEAARQAAVTLAQRAWPFIEMMKAAHAADREITWGV